MDRAYLQDPLTSERMRSVVDWHRQIVSEFSRDTVWAVVDGAILGAQGLELLRTVYGDPARAFDNTALSDYEELGLLLWPLSDAVDKDALDALRTALSGRPGLSFVRTDNSFALLAHTLTWLTGVFAEDGLALYLRIGDTRVLPGLVRHLHPEHHAVIQGAVKEWAWFDRTCKLRFVRSDGGPPSAVPTEARRIDDAQYAALLEDAAIDVLHVELRKALVQSRDSRTSSELHTCLKNIVERAEALGLMRLQDQVIFAVLALDAPEGFEAVDELGQTWLDVRSGALGLGKRIEQWGDSEWSGIEHFRRSVAARQASDRFASTGKRIG